MTRIVSLLLLVVVAGSLGGCTSCGFIWNDWGKSRSCQSDAPPQQ